MGRKEVAIYRVTKPNLLSKYCLFYCYFDGACFYVAGSVDMRLRSQRGEWLSLWQGTHTHTWSDQMYCVLLLESVFLTELRALDDSPLLSIRP